MKTPETKGATRPAQESRNERGLDPFEAACGVFRQDHFGQDKEDARALNVGARSLAEAFEAGKRGVHNVHTLGFGSGRTGAALGQIAEVFGGAADFQGRECSSSPTSGTVFPQVSGFLAFEC